MIGGLVHLMAKPTDVYSCCATDGEVLYVGCSVNVFNRLDTHRTREWFQLVSRVEIEHFPDRSSALAREAELIDTLKPAHNVFNPVDAERARAERRRARQERAA